MPGFLASEQPLGNDADASQVAKSRQARKKPIADDVALDWIRLRCDGLTSSQIGDIYGETSERVRTVTNKILRDDLMYSGERKRDVLAGYW